MKKLILLVISLALVTGTYVIVTYAQDQEPQYKYEVKSMNNIHSETERKAYQKALDKALQTLSIPEGYELKEVRSGIQNKSEVWIFRYEKSNGENNGLKGEHYSFTVNKENNKILGFSWMDQRFESSEKLLSKKQTEKIAKSFLNRIEPGLFDRLENLWIRPHDEVITVDGQQMTVTGMKFKCYLSDEDTYAWVIIGPDEKIITFEQGIKWESGRKTEKWLHDSWLENTIN
ncbi:hypothetical protein HNO89_002820 [Sporosarcina luteola]|nr:hypothetical protein [Sporosarcina luteola]